MNEPHERLAYIRKKRGYKTATAFADAHVSRGVSKVTYAAHERGSRNITRTIDLYAELLRTTPQWLQYGTGSEDLDDENHDTKIVDIIRGQSKVRDNFKEPDQKGRLNSREGPGGIPIYASVPGPGRGWLMLNSPSFFGDALSELDGVENARGFLMPSDEMDPVIVSGEILYPHPSKQAKNRSIVMVRMKAFPDEWVARELVARDVTQITLREYGPGLAPVETIIEWSDIESMTVLIRER